MKDMKEVRRLVDVTGYWRGLGLPVDRDVLEETLRDRTHDERVPTK